MPEQIKKTRKKKFKRKMLKPAEEQAVLIQCTLSSCNLFCVNNRSNVSQFSKNTCVTIGRTLTTSQDLQCLFYKFASASSCAVKAGVGWFWADRLLWCAGSAPSTASFYAGGLRRLSADIWTSTLRHFLHLCKNKSARTPRCCFRAWSEARA